MPHQQRIRIVPGAKTAVLMMHGIAGTPDHFRTLLPLEDLIPENWSLYNIIMDGHGKRVEDFSHSSMAAWEQQTMDCFHTLCQTHEQVILVGHSMGTLFAMDMAREQPEKVAFLFLIEVPLRVGVKAFAVRNLIRFAFGKLDLCDPVQEATSRVCSIRPTRMVWKYLGWIPRMLELIRKMHTSAKLVAQLAVPTVAYQSRRDELVSNRSAKILSRAGTVEVHEFVNSTHFYYHPDDIARVRERFIQACGQMKTPPTD